MTTLSADTHPDAERVLLRLLREATPEKKWHSWQSLNRMALPLAEQGIRDALP